MIDFAVLLRFFRMWLTLSIALLLTACMSSPPKKIHNICHIFDEKDGWYKDAKKASKRWDIPIPVNMAIMRQESSFVSKAKPPRRKILWVIPGPRLSNAYGYSQAKKETWDWYKKSSGHRGADRDDFDDAIDFVAWYNRTSADKLGIAPTNVYALYLAYHEGHGGYRNESYKSKAWLKQVAQKVSANAQRYTAQLEKCEKRLNSRWWWPF